MDTLFDHFCCVRPYKSIGLLRSVSHQRYRPLKIGQLLAEVPLQVLCLEVSALIPYRPWLRRDAYKPVLCNSMAFRKACAIGRSVT